MDYEFSGSRHLPRTYTPRQTQARKGEREKPIELTARNLLSPPILPFFYPPQVFATLDPSKGYKGISCFVVEKEMGIQIAKKEKKVCRRGLVLPASTAACTEADRHHS